MVANGNRLDGIQAARAVAACGVVACHLLGCETKYLQGPPVASSLCQFGVARWTSISSSAASSSRRCVAAASAGAAKRGGS
jgi:hypothetical protein